MDFDTQPPETPPAPPVVVTLDKNENGDLDLYYDGKLVGYFDDGVLYTIQYGARNSVKQELEAKGVKFVERKNNIGYRIKIDL